MKCHVLELRRQELVRQSISYRQLHREYSEFSYEYVQAIVGVELRIPGFVSFKYIFVNSRTPANTDRLNVRPLTNGSPCEFSNHGAAVCHSPSNLHFRHAHFVVARSSAQMDIRSKRGRVSDCWFGSINFMLPKRSKHSGASFRSTFQGREYSIWATKR